MCFSPQWRAIFRHLNFQKWSKHAVFCTFWLANVLFATAACNFWFRLWAPTSAPAALTGLLFDWPDTRIIEKTQHFATSLTFGADVSSFFWLSRYCIFCRLTWLLYYCFSTLHIVGSFYLNFLRLGLLLLGLLLLRLLLLGLLLLGLLLLRLLLLRLLLLGLLFLSGYPKVRISEVCH